MVIELLTFLGLAAVIFFSGKNLAKYGDIIAEKKGLGKAWIGLVLVATVTSLPELTVGISSVTIVGSADLAIGDVLGSCVFNLFLLSIIDAFVTGVPLSSKVSPGHILAASMSIILVTLVGLGLFLPGEPVITSWIGISSIIFIAVYFVSIRLIYLYEQKVFVQKVIAYQNNVPDVPLKRAVLLYAVNAVVVVGAAVFLPGLADGIAEKTGLGESFVGTLFLAASTSLPEAAVSIAAIRMGAFDLAVGNLIGSNLFNILILSIDDLFYTKGYLLKDGSDNNMISVFSVIMMTAVAMGGLMYHSPKKKFFLAWDAVIIALIYIANLVLLYYLR